MLLEIPKEFPLGNVVATRTAMDTINPGDIFAGLLRHSQCDWGDLSGEDKALNDLALIDGGRLLSAYHDSAGVKFWIITEWDRSATTVLLPNEY